MDGASERQVFRHVTLPSIRPLLMILTFLSIIWDFKVFTQVYAMRQGGPDGQTVTLSVYSYIKGISESHYDIAAAVSMVMVMLLLVVLIPYIRGMIQVAGGSVSRIARRALVNAVGLDRRAPLRLPGLLDGASARSSRRTTSRPMCRSSCRADAGQLRQRDLAPHFTDYLRQQRPGDLRDARARARRWFPRRGHGCPAGPRPEAVSCSWSRSLRWRRSRPCSFLSSWSCATADRQPADLARHHLLHLHAAVHDLVAARVHRRNPGRPRGGGHGRRRVPLRRLRPRHAAAARGPAWSRLRPSASSRPGTSSSTHTRS